MNLVWEKLWKNSRLPLICSALTSKQFLFALTEDGSSFAPKRLIKLVVKDLSIVLIKNLSIVSSTVGYQ